MSNIKNQFGYPEQVQVWTRSLTIVRVNPNLAYRRIEWKLHSKISLQSHKKLLN